MMASPADKKFRTAHLVDEECLSALANSNFALTEEALPAIRQFNLIEPATKEEIDAAGVAYEERQVPSSDGAHSVLLLIYSPKGNTKPIPGYLDIHGGGFILGSPYVGSKFAVRLVKELNIVVVSVKYRLAPEHPGLAAVEDCYTALSWLFEHGHDVHVDKARIAFGGPSAGGGLAAALGLYTRDRKQFHPIFQLLVYPMLDDRTCLKEDFGHTGEFLWTPSHNRFGWQAHLGKDTPVGSEGVSPYLVPARATDLSGLPPTYISTGALDLFLEEDIDYARRLLAAGVATELHVYPGMAHGADMLAPNSKLGKRFIDDYVAALAHHLTKKS